MSRRPFTAALAVAVSFAATAALLLAIMPSPHTKQDYVIAGTCATLMAMVVLFMALGGLGFFRPPRR
jgi:hypothetical protein